MARDSTFSNNFSLYGTEYTEVKKVTEDRKMNATLWVLVAIKIFVIFWLIYYIFERRKRKGSVNNLAVTEQGIAGVHVTQVPKSCNEYSNQQQLYPNLVSPNIQPSTGIADPHPNVLPIK